MTCAVGSHSHIPHELIAHSRAIERKNNTADNIIGNNPSLFTLS